MIRQELVDEEKWVSNDRFNRVLGVYQALPGPEAHELCVYFGMVARGRFGGFLAGLGFMLPGFVFMFILSWFYLDLRYVHSPLPCRSFSACRRQWVLSLSAPSIASAAIRLTDGYLWVIAGMAAIAEILGTPFLLTLAGFGSGIPSLQGEAAHLGLCGERPYSWPVSFWHGKSLGSGALHNISAPQARSHQSGIPSRVVPFRSEKRAVDLRGRLHGDCLSAA